MNVFDEFAEIIKHIEQERIRYVITLFVSIVNR